MVKIRALVPLHHPTTDEEFAPDQVVDVADDVAAEWRAAGKVTLIDDEERNAQSATHYSDVTGREDVAPLGAGGAQPGPQTEEDEEQPRSKKGRK